MNLVLLTFKHLIFETLSKLQFFQEYQWNKKFYRSKKSSNFEKDSSVLPFIHLKA